MLLLRPWMMWLRGLRHRFWQRLWLKGRVCVGPGRPKVAPGVRVTTPWAGLHGRAGGTPEHGRPLHWRAFERRRLLQVVLVTRMRLHAAVAGEAGTASPLQLRHRSLSLFVNWFVKQTIPEEPEKSQRRARESGPKGGGSAAAYSQQRRTFLSPGAPAVLGLHVRRRPVLDCEGHRLLHHVGTVAAWEEERTEVRLGVERSSRQALGTHSWRLVGFPC